MGQEQPLTDKQQTITTIITDIIFKITQAYHKPLGRCTVITVSSKLHKHTCYLHLTHFATDNGCCTSETSFANLEVSLFFCFFFLNQSQYNE